MSKRASLMAQMVRNLPTIQETQILNLGQQEFPGERCGWQLQYYCLENAMDKGAWWATVNGVAECRIGLSD